jgi:Fe-S cluster biogenesis protein NfuA
MIATKIMIYTEQTPNPESLKFVTNKMLYRGTADFDTRELAIEWSPLAAALYEMPFVKSVYISSNFVTITKEMNYEWVEIMAKLREFIQKQLEENTVIIQEGFAEAMDLLAAERRRSYAGGGDDAMSQRIRELIDTYVKPAVEMDGGNIEFQRYEEGVVYVQMQGSCSGCPSSTVTLKAGIEGMLKRMVPEVKEVVQEMA